jgi:hypothetical protein
MMRFDVSPCDQGDKEPFKLGLCEFEAGWQIDMTSTSSSLIHNSFYIYINIFKKKVMINSVLVKHTKNII